MADEAIIIGEGWLSEHYFTTDAKSQSFHSRALARRKEWDVQDADGTPSVRARFSAMRAQLESRLATLVPGSDDVSIRDDVYRPLREALGFHNGGYHLEQDGPLLRVTQPGLSDGSPFVVVEARPAGTLEDLLAKDAETLLVPFEVDDNEKHAVTSVARLLSTLFVDDEGPVFALVLAGQWLLLAEKERWAEGRYLAVDLQLVVSRNDTKRGGEIDRALTCISAEALAPDVEGDIWWTSILEESIKHTVGVSQDLREGVRLSIEIIANDVVARRRRAGVEALPRNEAQTLAKQSLRFLYRILFLLYAEASPELKVLPVGASEYEEGYSLDRLRELTLVTLPTERAEHGTHLYESLAVLFRLVDQGHSAGPSEIEPVENPDENSSDLREGLTFNSLRADLFLPEATALIDEVKLSDVELQKVLAHLLLSKEQKGRDRGFISYADLGINQLGAVYEGLMSYTGFFAETQLYEVAKDGNSEKGSWVVPVERSQGIEAKDFVKLTDPITGEVRSVIHEQGSFVFRLAGRERQQSASYYTPEVLTRFTVSQALEELLDQNDTTTTSAEILELTVCEPALGSGAFALEAVRQLAEQYLKRRQAELGAKISPDAYPGELQRAKASIALHQVYGVDLNATAVELAEISLWLDTMSADLQAPWFGLHLKRGNSLIGARRAVYSRDQVNSRGWLKAVPRIVPVSNVSDDLIEARLEPALSGDLHQFLLPADGWGSATEAREAKGLAPEALASLRAWRRRITSKPSKKQLDQLARLALRVETLWKFALRRLQIAEREARRDIPLWGATHPESSAKTGLPTAHVSREEIETKLADPDGAYQRLRRVMDAWNALWFWPLTDSMGQGVKPPSLDEWIAGLTALLGTHFEVKPRLAAQGQTPLAISSEWGELGITEDTELGFAMVSPVHDALASHPWLRVADNISKQQGFFHWELDFAPVFARGGFDLQVGNPPWVRPTFDESDVLAETNVWWALQAKPSEEERSERRNLDLADPRACESYVDAVTIASCTNAYLGDSTTYPLQAGAQSELSRCFLESSWLRQTPSGVVAFIHKESLYGDLKANDLRRAAYRHLRRHFHFQNQLHLFDIGGTRTYGVNVYGRAKGSPKFLSMSWLFHPDTANRSFAHNGSGPPPGLKTEESKWDLLPHAARLVWVDSETLVSWADTNGDPSNVSAPQIVYTVNGLLSAAINKMSAARRASSLAMWSASGWHEKNAKVKGYIVNRVETPVRDEEAILQGPHIGILAPFVKQPNPANKSKNDWFATDYEKFGAESLPLTAYQPTGDGHRFAEAFGSWGPANNTVRIVDSYRLVWRQMVDPNTERTLQAAIIPPGYTHVASLALGGGPPDELVGAAGFWASLPVDFLVKISGQLNVQVSLAQRLPVASVEHPLFRPLALRALRLNAITASYSTLWNEFGAHEWVDAWSKDELLFREHPLAAIGQTWTPESPLRIARLRRQALVEIDAIVSIMLGLSADELAAIYRAHFPVLRKYENTDLYDAKGRVVPASIQMSWRTRGEQITERERTLTNASGNTYTYEMPFTTLDREADMRQAHAHFEQLVLARS